MKSSADREKELFFVVENSDLFKYFENKIDIEIKKGNFTVEFDLSQYNAEQKNFIESIKKYYLTNGYHIEYTFIGLKIFI